MSTEGTATAPVTSPPAPPRGSPCGWLRGLRRLSTFELLSCAGVVITVLVTALVAATSAIATAGGRLSSVETGLADLKVETRDGFEDAETGLADVTTGLAELKGQTRSLDVAVRAVLLQGAPTKTPTAP